MNKVKFNQKTKFRKLLPKDVFYDQEEIELIAGFNIFIILQKKDIYPINHNKDLTNLLEF